MVRMWIAIAWLGYNVIAMWVTGSVSWLGILAGLALFLWGRRDWQKSKRQRGIK